MAMSDARKRRIMWEVLGALLLFGVIWVVIQFAILANAAADEESKRERCLASTSAIEEFVDCVDAP